MIAAPGEWSLSLDVAHGSFETSHVASCPDVAPECAVLLIPPHKHEVTLGLTRYQIDARYGLRDGMQLSLRVPYDVKKMDVVYTTLDGRTFTPPYGDIHHRTETMTGIADPTLSLDWEPRQGWIVGMGTTLPAGSIESDPVAAGAQGIAHQHIQFGTGTFQPRLAVQWLRRGSNVTVPSFFARAEAKLGLYENREGYHPPTTITAAAGPSIPIGRISIDPRINGQYQTIGKWNGQTDEGTGLRSAGVTLQMAIHVRDAVIAPSVYRELWSHGLHEGEKFAQKWTFSVGVSRSF